MYDIIFISYGEPNAEANWAKLISRFPLAKRVKDVTGIQNAHIAAAKKSFTQMFWVVDGDAEILDTFNFDYKVPEWDLDAVHVWRSRNPLNDLEYGYGGVKLLPKKLTLAMDINTTDMTTSISPKFYAMEEVSNITAFNTDPFNTWRSAFRECVKLSSRVIEGQVNDETETRLTIWKTIGNADSVAGATAGARFGWVNRNKPEELIKINDYNWLREQYEKLTKVVTNSVEKV
jgi:hypothetical protein